MKQTKPEVLYFPQNATQKALAHKWDDSKIIILSGPAGTGKTAAAIGESLKRLANKEINKLYLARPTVSVDEELGFFPGTVEEKLLPYFGAFADVMEDITWEKMEAFNIECLALGLIRGKSIKKNQVLILDESQNATYKQLVCAITRLNSGSKLVIIGDPKQTDFNIYPNPFTEVISKIAHIEGVSIFNFGKSDQMRDPFLNQLIDALT